MMEKIRYWLWIYHCYCPFKININLQHKMTVVLTYFNQERIKHAKHMVRLLLRCTFISEILVNSHNPSIDIFEWVDIRDKRLKLFNNKIKRGPGFRWFVCNSAKSDYFMFIDDDFLIFPKQLVLLFRYLVEEPDIPHGLTGAKGIRDKFCRNMNTEVEVLYQIYAVTYDHIQKYKELSDALKLYRPDIYPYVEECGDDIVISMTGNYKPKIHDVGYNLRCNTARKKGVALHQKKSFMLKRDILKQTLDELL